MGWFFRKSVSMGGGVRLNFSKSGVGVSGGTRGFRVSTGPIGTYVNLGRNGIYYRQRIGNGSPSASGAPDSSQRPDAHPQAESGGLDLSSARTLNEINGRLSQPAYYGPLAGLVGFACLVAAAVSIWLAVGVAAALAYPLYLVHVDDLKRRSYSLHYEFDECRKRQWLQLYDALQELGGCQGLWRISSRTQVLDAKRNAGAATDVSRSPVRLIASKPPLLETDVLPYCLDLGAEKLFFLPDQVYVYSAGRYGSLGYDQFCASASTLNFIEAYPPRDASVVGRTWQYVNKDGSPDKRFAANPQLSIAAYAELVITWTGGPHVVILASRRGAEAKLTALFPPGRSGQGSTSGPNASGADRSRRDTTAEPPPGGHPSGASRPSDTSEQSGPTGQRQDPHIEPADRCFHILGLERGCTKEQAVAAYRELARQYHPDLVSHMAPEIQQLAELRMKEINGAYMEIKSLRGW